MAAPGDAPAPSSRVLLVDDEKSLTDVAALILGADGFCVDVAATGGEAVARVAGSAPDAYGVVLLDLGLPDMRGADALGRIRALRPDLPVVQCSGGRDPLLPGAQAVLAKPFPPQALLATVRRFAASCVRA